MTTVHCPARGIPLLGDTQIAAPDLTRASPERKECPHVPSPRHPAGGSDRPAVHRRPVRVPRPEQHGARHGRQLQCQRPALRAGLPPRGTLRVQGALRRRRLRDPDLPGVLQRTRLRRAAAPAAACPGRRGGGRGLRSRRPGPGRPDRTDGHRERDPALGRAHRRLLLHRPVAAGPHQRSGGHRDRTGPVRLAAGERGQQLRRHNRLLDRAGGLPPAPAVAPPAPAPACGVPPSSLPTRVVGGRSTGPGTR
jgi:hypothetical protein